MNPTHPSIASQAAWCRDALAVQGASNISGIAHSWADLCVAMHGNGMSTTAIADHPACQLYAAKMADICGLNYHYPSSAEAFANRLIQQAEAESKLKVMA